MIKAVLFDVDGVLLDSFEANLKFYQNLMEWAGYPPPTREEFPPLFHLAMWDAIKVLTKSKNENEIKKIWEAGRSEKIEYPLELLTMPSYAAQTIQLLSTRYALAIVTSRVQESVYELPALAVLKQCFLVTVSYQDTLNHKPDPEPLLFAAQKLGVEPAESCYIGDVQSDMKAAKAAGMKGILYAQQTVPEADACTFSFANLPELIRSL